MSRTTKRLLGAGAILLALLLTALFLFRQDSFTPRPIPAPMAADRDALVALYLATDGANWRNSANWLSDAPLDTWYGVGADDSGRVIRLNLSENELRGEIPSELGALTNLVWLNLGNNELRGAVPAELGNLTILKELYLYNNRLSGSIPPELGNLINLTQLSLSSSQLRGEIPAELGNLTNLTDLYLSGNQLSGSIPPELGNLTNLKKLFLAGGGLSLSGCVPEVVWRHSEVEESDLGQLDLPFCAAPSSALSAADREALVALYRATNGANWLNSVNWLSAAPLDTWHGITTDGRGRVIELALSENMLSGEIPSELGNLTNLDRLNLSFNMLSGSIPSELGNLTNLTRLNLSQNRFSGEIPPELGNLTNLERLYLRDSPISPWAHPSHLSGEIPSELGNLTNLTELDLRGHQLSGEIPSVLGNLTNLTHLYLSGNQLTGEIPSELGKLTNLTHLYLSASWPNLESNQFSGSIPPELGNLTNLTRLDLSNNQLSGEIPSELGNLTNLGGLDLSNNQLSGSIPTELANLYNLTTLDLSNNQLSDFIPTDLANLYNLVELDLHTNQLHGEIPPELGNLANLTRLYLYNNQLSGEMPEGPDGPWNMDKMVRMRPHVSWCTSTQTAVTSFQLHDGKTVSICGAGAGLIYSFGVPGGEPELQYRGPLLREVRFTASLWGEGSSSLAELAASMGNDEIAAAAESRDTNGFYRVSVFGWGLRRMYIFFRREGWEFAISSTWGGIQTYEESHEVGVTSPTGEVHFLR